MSLLRVILCLLAIAFLMACVWAYMSGDFVDEFQTIFAMPWGKVATVDLYFGLALFAIIVLAFEPIWIGLPVVLLMLALGNWVTAFWLAWRLPKIIRKMRGVA